MFLRIENNGLGAVGRRPVAPGPRARRRISLSVPAILGLRGLGAIGFGPGDCPMVSNGKCTNNPGSTNAADYFECGDIRECDLYTGRQHYEYQVTNDSGLTNANTWYMNMNGTWVWLGPNGTPAAPPPGAVPPNLASGAFTSGPTYTFGGGGSGGTGTGYTPIPGTSWCRDNRTGSVVACPQSSAPPDPLAPSTPGSPYSTQEFPRGASIVNATRGGSGFTVGDDWAITVKGDPGKPVTASATQDGRSLGEAAYGVTDSQGVFRLAGRMTADTVGAWTEQWKVGGETVGSVSFRVQAPAGSAPPASNGGTRPPAGSTPPAGGSFLDNLLPASDGSGFDLSFFSKPVSLFGFSFPLGGLLVAGAAGLYLFKGKR